MPYIPKEERRPLDKLLAFFTFKMSWGQIHYFIIKFLLKVCKPRCYEDYMKIIGTLEMIKLELYRKRIGKYEDGKCEKNGEVYTI